MKRSCPITQRIKAVLACSAFAVAAHGQSVTTDRTSTSQPPPSNAPSDDQVTKLSPFEVTAAKDNGYAATDTLAGTRIRTDLKDVGASISVLTKQFLDDIGATDNGTLLQYTPNAEVAGTRGTYAGLGNGTGVDESANLRAPAGAQRVRGLAAADNARDYYVTDIPWDSFNVDRIDILRGPNSILFGLGSPAGIVNASTHNAEFRNLGSVEFRVGSYGSARTSLDLNQQIIPGVLAIRVDGLMNNENYEQKPAFSHDKRLYGTIRYDPQLFKNRSFHTSIKAKFEHGKIDADRPRIVPPNDAITPWWRPTAISASNPFGGLGQVVVSNPYDPWRTDNVVPGTSYGLTQATTVNFQPWLNDIANQQQPIWFINGANNQLYQTYGGYINNGAVNSTGGFTGVSSGLAGKYTNGMFYGISNLPSAAVAYKLPGYQYGQYRNMSLLDPTVFDFYHNLIDGPSKHEWEEWNTQSFDFSQTAFDDRLGLQLSYDRQKYDNGGESFIGGSPTLTLDLLKNFGDYYLSGADGETSITNKNFGRPYVVGANNNGGRSYSSLREYKRASLFAELRASDLTSNRLLVKLLGKHRFNGVAADEKYFNENRTWQMFANSQAWAGYWNGNDGSSSAFTDRAPIGVVYLGPSVVNRSSASGAYIPGVGAPVTLQDAGVYVFDTTWKGGTSYGNAWTIPSSLQQVYNPATATTQASNPANYAGWNSNFQDTLLRYNDGQDNRLLTLAQKSLRETTSYSGSYQGYFWNNAFVATLGWRYDEVKTKDVTAAQLPLDRSMLNLQPTVYTLPDTFPSNQIIKGHSTSGGAVLHLNNLVQRDPLPIDVSLSYNESSNFQVTSVRRDLYGTPIGNPAGKTYEYGALLATKNGKISFRVVKYTTRVANASSGLSDPGGIGRVIQQGLRWRNVFLYQLGGYDWASRNQPSYRNTWTNAYPGLTADQAAAQEDAAINAWNDIQKTLDAKGFFKAWNFSPTTSSALVNRTTYLSNPSAYAPDPSTIYAYSAAQPQGFTVTANTESKGYEYELTANPLPNWRVAFNASETSAVRTDVGGATLDAFIAYMDSKLYNSDGTLTPAGGLPQFGGATNSIAASVYGPWRANYALMKLQEGTAASELRKWRYNFVTNYTFRGENWLRGVGVGGGYRWQDKVIIGYPMTANGGFDLTKPFYGPSEDAIDLWASYEHKLTDKVNWKIQLNVRNAFAKDGLIPISIEPDGKTYASVRVKPVQEWFVTNTFSF